MKGEKSIKYPGHGEIMHRIDSILDKVMHIISVGLVAFPGILVVAWVLVFAVFITGRTLFKMNWMFIEEYTTYWLVLIVFFGLAYALRTGGHIYVAVVVKLLPTKGRNILAVVTNFLALCLICYLMWRGVEWFKYGYASGARSDFPSNTLLWPVFLIIPIGLAFLGLEQLRQLYHSVIRLLWTEEVRLK